MTVHPAFPIDPPIRLRDGRIIRTADEAAALVRTQELRPGIDRRDEVLHLLERAGTGEEQRAAVEAFRAWLDSLEALAR